ncbi:S1C family serine protease [Halobium salinum]|uniref:S1C family serine protease n=1 Tax=Halobium salinum TaxID=1364940 RepID=A0ABD5P7N3_9EURY|nr:trypsin-like peptidase domain-containing protein [Halobium salinum]
MRSDIDYERLYEDVIPSVVSLYVGREAPGTGSGSGFVYDDGHVVTNAHVVGRSLDVELRFSDGSWRTGEVVGTDHYTDLAVVAVEDLPNFAKPLPVAESNPHPGRPVAALGNPLGLDGSITAGIVSGANRSMGTPGGFAIPDVVQTDAPINPGNSGGPLVAVVNGADSGGHAPDHPRYEVVGVNRAKQGDNIGFAVSPEIVNRVVPDLLDGGRFRHSYLRTRTLDVTPSVAEANELDEPRGVLVVDVNVGPTTGDSLRGSDYTRTVGGREIPVGGDVIVGMNGTELRSHEELMRYLITRTRPGEPVELDVVRDGAEVRLSIVLDERPDPESRFRGRSGRGGRQRRGPGRGGRGRGDDDTGPDGDDGGSRIPIR